MSLEIVLVRPRFPENIGMAARAAANMGAADLCIVLPEHWDLQKSLLLATSQGAPLLYSAKIVDSLGDAVSESHLVIGSTARTGGWRRNMLNPETTGEMVSRAHERGEKVSLVFGSEDRGLSNNEITCCQYLVNIPTMANASSLNLAQAVLLLLYECAKAGRQKTAARPAQNAITAGEQARLMEAFKKMLLVLDHLHGENPDYFMLPWRSFFSRAKLSRNEYDAFMGLCRQVINKVASKH